MKDSLYIVRMIGAVAVIGYGIFEASVRPHRYDSGFLFIGLGFYFLWRNWRLLKDPSLRPPPRTTLTHVVFWVGLLLAATLLWWVVQAR